MNVIEPDILVPEQTLAAASAPDVTRVSFAAWLRQSRAGARCVYHRGHLAVDRHPLTTLLTETARRDLDLTADLAYAMAAAGRVLLVQRRQGSGGYAYIAVKTGPHAVALRCALCPVDARKAAA